MTKKPTQKESSEDDKPDEESSPEVKSETFESEEDPTNSE